MWFFSESGICKVLFILIMAMFLILDVSLKSSLNCSLRRQKTFKLHHWSFALLLRVAGFINWLIDLKAEASFFFLMLLFCTVVLKHGNEFLFWFFTVLFKQNKLNLNHGYLSVPYAFVSFIHICPSTLSCTCVGSTEMLATTQLNRILIIQQNLQFSLIRVGVLELISE